MTLHRTPLVLLVIAAVSFVLALVVFAALRGADDAGGGAADAPSARLAARSRSTDARVAALQAAVRSARADQRVTALTSLGEAYLQKARETGDAAWYGRAGRALDRALALGPRSPEALTGAAVLAAARHDFGAALALGEAAQRRAPHVVRPLGVIADAQIELGRYGAAGRTLQAMVDRQPNLASYARVSYFRELHGDLAGAERVMRLAVSAGAGVPENEAYVQTLAGNLAFARGRLQRAERSYRAALDELEAFVPALAGLARIDAARGALDRAIRRLRVVVARLPLPAYAVLLGETEQAAGRSAAAARDLALVPAELRLMRVAGVRPDADVVLFEADHGSPRRGVALARALWRRAPSVRSADALGWALTRAGRPVAGLRWARRALRLGSRDPAFLHHAGMAALAAGRPSAARRWLAASLAGNPRWSPLRAPEARRALEALG